MQRSQLAPPLPATQPDRRTARAPERPAEAGPRPGLPPRRATFLGSLGWGVLGFLTGAAFWNLVGLWDFLGSVVYRQDRSASVVERLFNEIPGHGTHEAVLATSELAARDEARNCTTLVRDRVTGQTRAAACTVVIRSIAGEAGAERRDVALQTAARIDLPASGR